MPVSSAIDDYNQHAINDAGAGHSAIRAYKDGFRVIASTATVNARDNAALTGTGVENLLAGRCKPRSRTTTPTCSTGRGTA